MQLDFDKRIQNATKAIRDVFSRPATTTVLVLGSGFERTLADMQIVKELSYSAIPGFPVTTVQGHAGKLLLCNLSKDPQRQVFVLSGRFHFYEGHTLQEVTLPIRVLHHLGVKHVILTNASGGIRKDLEVGDCMVIRDHINLMESSPLRGPNLDEYGSRFPDMSEVYDAALRLQAFQIAEQVGVSLKEGVYIGVVGPQYETPAEIQMFRAMGADAVGMSTVPEAIVARHQGMRVLGFSIIANKASGLTDKPLSHDEVVTNVGRATADLGKVICEILTTL